MFYAQLSVAHGGQRAFLRRHRRHRPADHPISGGPGRVLRPHLADPDHLRAFDVGQ